MAAGVAGDMGDGGSLAGFDGGKDMKFLIWIAMRDLIA